MSLYIPRVFANITEKRVMEVFEKSEIGKVSNVDFITKIGKDKKVYNSAYVHFEYWYDNTVSQNIQNKLEAGKETKIMYDDPWYWVVYKNMTKKFGGNGPRKERLVIEKAKESTEKKALPEIPNDVFQEEVLPEFTQEELDEIERNLLEDFDIEVNQEGQDGCFDLVDANYVAMLESRLAYYECPWIYSF